MLEEEEWLSGHRWSKSTFGANKTKIEKLPFFRDTMYRKAFVGQIGDMFIMTALSAHTLMYSTSAKRKPGTTRWQTTKQGRGCASCIHHPPTESNCTAVQMWNLLAQWYFTIAQLCKLRRSRYCALGSRRELLWRRSSSAIETSALALAHRYATFLCSWDVEI